MSLYDQLIEAQIKEKCEQYSSGLHKTPGDKEPTE